MFTVIEWWGLIYSVAAIDDVHSGWGGAGVVAACTSWVGLDAFVVPHCNPWTTDLMVPRRGIILG